MGSKTVKWTSCRGCWSWEATQPVEGDFNGDGKDDVGAFYNYGNGYTGLWIWYSNGSGLNAPVRQWLSCPGCWSWEATKPVEGDFNGDGMSEVGAFYNYGNGYTGLWTFGGPALTTAVRRWLSCPGCSSWEATKPA